MFIKKFILLTATAALIGSSSCRKPNEVNPNLARSMPNTILWAWERPEDLRFLDAGAFGAAFLAQTLTLKDADVIFRPRRQPLEVAPDVYLIAVTRIETVKDAHSRPRLSAEQKEKAVSLIEKTLQLPGVRHVQIDFDAVVSEREFYRSLMIELRSRLPKDVPLTMTSLASWCIGDSWFNDFPVDEAVPMPFRMGADDEKIRAYLGDGNDWNEPLCRGSYGVALDEPLAIEYDSGRRFYIFNPKSWKPGDLERLNAQFRRSN